MCFPGGYTMIPNEEKGEKGDCKMRLMSEVQIPFVWKAANSGSPESGFYLFSVYFLFILF